jgi:DNA-binding LytR/AlgR family response regulator
MISNQRQSRWSIKAELILNAGLTLLMMAGMWFFHLIRGRENLTDFWLQLGMSFTGAVILSSLLTELYRFKKHNKNATDIRLRFNRRQRLDVTPEGTVTFPLYKKGETAFRPEDILGIEQDEQGLRVHVQINGIVTRESLACDMKTVRDILRKHTAFYRCSRSWMVNMDRVTGIDADAAGFRLSLAENAIWISVSSQLNQELGIRLSK